MGDLKRRLHVVVECRFIADDDHCTPPENVRRAHENGISNLTSDSPRFFQSDSRPIFWLWDVQLTQQVAESLTIFGKVDGIRRCSDDRDSGMLQVQSEIERRLSPELHDDAIRFLFPHDMENVLKREWLEVEAIGRVIVSGHRLRVAIDHDRLEAIVL